MDSPLHRFRIWVDEQESRAAAARLLGCHSSYLTHLLADGSNRSVGLNLAFAIERETAQWSKGQICASEWADPPAESLKATGTGD